MSGRRDTASREVGPKPRDGSRRRTSCSRRSAILLAELRRTMLGSGRPRWSPRLHLGLRRHYEIGKLTAAVGAAEPQLDQRHVAAAGIDQGLQVSIAPMAAGLAPHQHPDIAGPQRRPRVGRPSFGMARRSASVAAAASIRCGSDERRDWHRRSQTGQDARFGIGDLPPTAAILTISRRVTWFMTSSGLVRNGSQ